MFLIHQGVDAVTPTFRDLLIRALDQGWTQAALARRLRVTPAMVNKWLQPDYPFKTGPRSHIVEALAEVLGLEPGDVWCAVGRSMGYTIHPAANASDWTVVTLGDTPPPPDQVTEVRRRARLVITVPLSAE